MRQESVDEERPHEAVRKGAKVERGEEISHMTVRTRCHQEVYLEQILRASAGSIAAAQTFV